MKNKNPYKKRVSMLQIIGLLLVVYLSAACQTFAAGEPDLASHPLYSKYQFGKEGTVVDMGSPP